ncbi:MAG: D-alanyl-D-alanine carboxypeptidase [bacterium]|nr:D-alanyl-D-alanine carboxypeptidase [bacterium]
MRREILRKAFAALLFLLIATSLSSRAPAFAEKDRRNISYQSILLLEAQTGRVLRSHNIRARLIPASLVKMMTVLLTLERIKAGTVGLDDVVTVSREASRIGGHQVYLAQGERFALIDLMKAILIGSANDAAYAVAEHVAGSVELFIQRMNEKARVLGMTDTKFVNVHGLPPDRRRPPNRMSARDAGILARALLEHPIVTEWGQMRHAPFRDGKFILTNTNRLVGRFPGVDGLKTGSYRAAGYSVVATAKRGNLRLIAIVLGSGHPRTRFKEARKLLSWGFDRYHWYQPAKNTEFPVPHTVQIRGGQKEEIVLRKKGDLRVLVEQGYGRKIMAIAEIPANIYAPVQAGQRIGHIRYELKGKKLGEIPLVATESVRRLSLFQSFIRLH